MAPEENQDRLNAFLQVALPAARLIDETLVRESPLLGPIELVSETDQMSHVAGAFYAADLESRRAVRLLRLASRGSDLEGGRLAGRPSPAPTSAAGLRLKRAMPGSLHALLDAYGDLEKLLLSAPLQTIITIDWCLGTRGRLRAWLSRGKGGVFDTDDLSVPPAFGDADPKQSEIGALLDLARAMADPNSRAPGSGRIRSLSGSVEFPDGRELFWSIGDDGAE